ncbi:MAG: hypothetical protein AAF696_08920 [Bacteroidota bacterium]
MVHTILDHDLGKKNIRAYYFYPVIILIFCGAKIAFSLLYGEGLSIYSTGFLLASCLFFMIREGVMIDTKTQRFKYYVKLSFLKLGRWQSYRHYPDLVVLRTNSGDRRLTFNFSRRVFQEKAFYEVYLVSKSHFRLILLNRYKERAEAESFAHEFGRMTGREWVQYNPGKKLLRRVLGGYA